MFQLEETIIIIIIKLTITDYEHCSAILEYRITMEKSLGSIWHIVTFEQRLLLIDTQPNL